MENLTFQPGNAKSINRTTANVLAPIGISKVRVSIVFFKMIRYSRTEFSTIIITQYRVIAPTSVACNPFLANESPNATRSNPI